MSELRVVLAAVALLACFAIVGVVHREHRPRDCFTLPDRFARSACLWRSMTPRERAEALSAFLRDPTPYREIEP